MRIAYPVLTGEIAKRGIKKSVIASALQISEKTLRNKMSGQAPFTWTEACKIGSIFFPDLEKDELFRQNP